jgi:hypothetical protein
MTIISKKCKFDALEFCTDCGKCSIPATPAAIPDASTTKGECRGVILHPKLMSEAELQALIVAELEAGGWNYFHDKSKKKNKAGKILDLYCWRETSLWIECKTERGKLTPEQQDTVNSLRAAGVEVFVVRPSGFEGMAARLRSRNPLQRTGDNRNNRADMTVEELNRLRQWANSF